MKRIIDPGYVYQAWTDERRKRHSDAATVRFYGSLEAAIRTRRRKLTQLKRKRDRLTDELNRVRSHIRHLERSLQ